ncbi:uncharacterized protein LOC117182744 [Belonocnema kinseyi]|uniref:uncharacterized protein LOC117182744 n=1 Tax=Belonocnema kinseyi TaxID=2817044 RepID=UPI00143DBEB5|nr:uncharacterized protein LOC117182744 [Belonocnema kinseyi]
MNVKVVIVILLSIECAWRIGCRRVDARSKRQTLYSPPIVYPNGGTFKLIVGVAVPIAMPGRTFVYGQNFQFQYALPQNLSFFPDFFSKSSRRRRDIAIPMERTIAYQFFEAEYERRGISGRDCMKRSICESAEIPLKDEGLVGELLEVLLTPNYGGGSFADHDYMEAVEAGRRGDDCLLIYPGCPSGYGILDYISQVDYLGHS